MATSDLQQLAASAPTWTPYTATPDVELAGVDTTWGTPEQQRGGSWGGANAPQEVGWVNSEGNRGMLYKGSDGYLLNGKPLAIDDATAQAWTSGAAEASRQQQESNNSGFGGFLSKYGWALPLLGVGAGALMAGGFTGAAGAAAGAEVGGMSTTPALLSSTAGTGANVLSGAGVTGLTQAGGAMSTTPALLASTSSPAWLSGAPAALTNAASGVQAPAPQSEMSFNSTLGDKFLRSSPSMLSSSLFSNPGQLLSSFAPGGGGGSSAGFGSISNLMNMGSGIYGMYQSQKLREMAAKASAGADTWGSTGGRNLASTQLQALMKDPSSITTMPGYEAGMQAVQRAMAAQGYTGSGNAMIALQKYGGDFYNNAIAQLGQLAGAQFNPASAAGIGLSGAESANELASKSLASLGYGMQRAVPNPITSWLR